ncbi:tyrosine-type recombinase/integrase [Ideonella sp. DXS29W]|uniref:Tyrosine-type recombinase/integrase n=1 Tax=Ideonella lacteola TaxID=2984193 RepID=A0ABU9BY91_9BURK
MSETHLPALGAVGSPASLESAAVIDGLSGRDGTNRSRSGHCQLAADTDREAVLAWLARYAGSPNTLANSRREAERLLLWALAERGKPLSSLTHEDLLLYQHFLADPQPAERWVMAPGRKLARGHPAWRPFAGPLSPASVRQAMVIVNSMLSWLVQAGYLAGNPLSLSRHRRSAAPPRVVRFLEDDLWSEVRSAIATLPKATEREQATYWRARWLFSLLYLCGLRISEVVGNTMGGFFSRTDPKTAKLRWWLHINGKGDKDRLVPATDELMLELTSYRHWLGLSPLPQYEEPSPLLFPVWWQAPSRGAIQWPVQMTRAAAHAVVKDIFEIASQRLRAKGPEHHARADKLRAASSHWLRHTMGSRLADGVDLRHIRDTFGHASLTTTGIYLHTEDDARHAAINGRHRLGWDSLAS